MPLRMTTRSDGEVLTVRRNGVGGYEPAAGRADARRRRRRCRWLLLLRVNAKTGQVGAVGEQVEHVDLGDRVGGVAGDVAARLLHPLDTRRNRGARSCSTGPRLGCRVARS